MRRRLAKATRRGSFAAVLGPALRLAVRRYALRLPGLGVPLKVALVADLHYGFAASGAARAAQVRARVMAMAPDLILFLGDIAGGWIGTDRAPRVDAGCAALGGYSAPLGCFAVLGNHDWDDDAAAVARAAGPNRAGALLERQGWRVLENAAVDLGPLWLAGLASQRAFHAGFHWGFPRRFRGLDDLGATLAGVPEGAPLLLMAHEPDVFPDLPDRALLTVSGHTHGGQIRLFGRPWVVPSRYGARYADGLFAEGRRQLVVSRGLGCSTIPLRIGAVPEIVLLTLTA